MKLSTCCNTGCITDLTHFKLHQFSCRANVLGLSAQGLGFISNGSGSQGAIRIGDEVTMTHEPSTSQPDGFVVLEWEASARADMIADAVVATLMQARSLRLPARKPVSSVTGLMEAKDSFVYIVYIFYA